MNGTPPAVPHPLPKTNRFDVCCRLQEPPNQPFGHYVPQGFSKSAFYRRKEQSPSAEGPGAVLSGEWHDLTRGAPGPLRSHVATPTDPHTLRTIPLSRTLLQRLAFGMLSSMPSS